MTALRTEIEIDAPPQVVWDVLTDFESYPDWNPHIVAASATVAEGEPVQLTVQPSGSSSKSISATLSIVDEPRELEWVGSIFASFLFKGRHGFELEPLEGDRTLFVNRETFGGILPPLVISEESEADYVAMNEALAAEVEAREAERPASEPSA